MRVTILGAGPAGLMAALAAGEKGHDVEIIADGEPSKIPGAQWLQRPIPYLTDGIKPTMITYAKVGTVDGYARKAYGEPEAQVSWDSFVSGDRPGWSLREAYEKLWQMFKNQITTFHLEVRDIEKLARDRDILFSSIPLKSICRDPIAHEFESQLVTFTDEPYIRIPNMIVYNGRESDEWYRTSCLFGESQTEYGIHDVEVPIHYKGPAEIRDGIKPVKNNCSCWTSYPNLIKIGRFGQWRRGVLTDHAYIDAKDKL